MKSRQLFRFCAGRLKVIFLIVSKAVASFSQPLMPGVISLTIEFSGCRIVCFRATCAVCLRGDKSAKRLFVCHSMRCEISAWQSVLTWIKACLNSV